MTLAFFFLTSQSTIGSGYDEFHFREEEMGELGNLSAFLQLDSSRSSTPPICPHFLFLSLPLGCLSFFTWKLELWYRN